MKYSKRQKVKSKVALLALITTVVLSGCAIKSEAPRAFYPQTTICLADNPKATPQAYLSIRRAILDKGYEVKRLKADDAGADCQQVLSYEAVFGTAWNASAIRYARLTVKEKDPPFDKTYSVEIDRRGTKASLLDTIPEAELELRELVDRLLPDNNPWRQ